MAGVYIKGLQMPDACATCICCDDAHWCNALNKRVALFMKRTEEPDCPLIPVPDHGRLGDLDELEKVMRHRKEFYGRVSDPDCLVADAPTIIPASGKDINAPTKEE